MLVGIVTTEERTVFELGGLPHGWAALLGFLALAGLCYGAIWLYRREARAGATLRVRVMLGVLRCTVLLLLAAVWLEPVFATYVKRTMRARVVVLADASTSMAIADAAAEEGENAAPGGEPDSHDTRIARVRRLLMDADHGWLRQLKQRNELSAYVFGDHAARLRLPWDTQPPGSTSQQAASSAAALLDLDTGLSAKHVRTDLSSALRQAIEDAGDSPLAGIVVLSDGVFNQGLSAEDSAAYARSFKAPVYSVGVGSEVEPPNVRVTNFSAPASVAKGDPLEVRAEVSAVGIESTSLKLELTVRPVDSAAGEEKVVATREVTVGGTEAPIETRFRVNADAAGEFVYRARVLPLAGEAVDFDNALAASVLVLDEKIKVLLVAGRPTYSYRYVTALLTRDKTIELSCWLQSADAQAVRDGDLALSELPRKPEEILGYDAILLLDPDPRELDPAWAVSVRRLVDELGGGLLLEAGPQYSSRLLRDERLTDMTSMLPITPDPEAEVRLSERGSFYTQPVPLRMPDEVRLHPILQLHNEAKVNRAVWDLLPGVWWYLPVLREKPLATVLLTQAGASPASGQGQSILLAAQPFGAGRTVYLGFDSSWRWRATAERYFDRFWIQLVRYLAQSRREGASRRGTIVLDREVVNVGDYVRVEARVLDPSFQPVHETEIEAQLEAADGQTQAIKLVAVPGREGWFAGRVTAEQDGPAILRIPLPGEGGLGTRPAQREALLKHFLVSRPDVEMQSLQMRREALVHLADQSGGRYTPIRSAGELPGWIEDASQVRTIPGQKQALWDRGWVLGMLAALLALEWTLRRRNHLL